MSTMTTGERQSFLMILRFNKEDKQDPLRCGVIGDNGDFEPVKRGQSTLVVAIVDPSKRSATTPMLEIRLDNPTHNGFNSVLKDVGDLNRRYRRDGGYISNPDAFTQNRQSQVLATIQTIGTHIYTVLSGAKGSVIKDWLDDLFRRHDGDAEGSDDGRLHHVTIITNDFSVPWYWLYNPYHDRFLCETVSLGMLQQADFSDASSDDGDQETLEKVRAQIKFRALLINGSPNLPYATGELEAVATGLTDNDANMPLIDVAVQDLASNKDLANIYKKHARQQDRCREFRLIHFNGDYSSADLVLNDEALEDRDLAIFVDRSLFVLDGCSNAEGIKAWTDIKRVTRHVMRQGAAGCLLPVLPVKNDPI